MRDVVLSLCDLTGNFTTPWVGAGYTAILVDPQHGITHWDGPTLKVAATVQEAMPLIRDYLPRLAFVAGWPPCTDMAFSGALWFEKKAVADSFYLGRAFAVAEQCRIVGELAGVPYFVENPRSMLSHLWGKADFVFQPWEYSEHEPLDNYTKATHLWTGGGFVMPPVNARRDLGSPDQRILNASAGPGRANFRSATPMGFSRAVFLQNSQLAVTA